MIRLLYILCVTTALAKAGVLDGDVCTTVDSEKGKCIKLPDCTMMFEMMLTLPVPFTATVNEYLKLSHCGFSGSTPMVCCPHLLSGRETFMDLSSHTNANLLTKNTCGISDQPRIHGGTKARLNEFPWMALLVYDSASTPYQCGGSVINERYVLTAAHCITSELRSVRIGEHTIGNDTDCEFYLEKLFCAPTHQQINIEKTIVHEFYSTRNIANDIALIRLERDIDFSVANAMPICLPIYQNLRAKTFVGQNMTVIGFGFTEKAKQSDVLLKVTVKVISNEECKARYSDQHIPGYIMSKKMCAGTAGQDSCRGDSGGPLMYLGTYDNSIRYVQYGIVSYGSWNCGSGTPGVYVRLVKYVKWILDHIAR